MGLCVTLFNIHMGFLRQFFELPWDLNWISRAVQLEGEFHLCIFRLSGYCKFSVVSTTNSSLNHYTSTTESVYFRHIGSSKTLKLNRDSLLKSTILAIESASDACRTQFRREVLSRPVCTIPLYGLRTFKPQSVNRSRTV